MYDFNDKPELNITPLVDIMLVLLAILMVTAPVIEFEEQINLPTFIPSETTNELLIFFICKKSLFFPLIPQKINFE